MTGVPAGEGGNTGDRSVEAATQLDDRQREAFGRLLWKRLAVVTGASAAFGILGGFVACWSLGILAGLIVAAVIGEVAKGLIGRVPALYAQIANWILGLPIPPRPRSRVRKLGLQVLMTTPAVITGFLTFAVVCGDAPPPPEDACHRVPSEDAVEVLVVWTRRELQAFCNVVAAYGNHPTDVKVSSVGTEIGAELDRRFERRDPPDVAIIAQPSLVRRYGIDGCLVPLDSEDINVAERFPEEWNRFVTTTPETGSSQMWGAFVKGADKSMFWHSRAELEGDSPQNWSWDNFTGWANDATSDDLVAPLAFPAADRWPSTDWFENQLAAVDPELYGALSRGEQVDWTLPSVRGAIREALQQMAELWGTDDVFVDDVSNLHLEDVADLLRNGEAAAVFSPSFLAGQEEDLYQDDRFWVFGFPTISGRAPRIVGGDIAVVPTQPDGAVVGDRFVDWLTNGEAMRRWSEADPGFLSPNRESPYATGEGSDVHRLLTNQLLDPQAELFFDLSDDRLAAINQHDPRGSWDIFADFFTDVTGDTDDDDAINEVIDRLEAEYADGNAPAVHCDWE